MLSYQWDIQDLVKRVYNELQAQGLPVWMDIHGGVAGNINESMAEGVEGAAVVCPFMTQKYSESKNCKKELNYTDGLNVPIVPVMAEKNFKATGWLGVITAGMLWIDFRNEDNFENSITSLAKEIIHEAGDQISIGETPSTYNSPTFTMDLEKKPGRAFKHKLEGKYLAESGQVKVHQMSGSRSSLVLRDEPEDTSYWVEEKKGDKSGIHFFKNFKTDGYMGYDPNGDYIYTKEQHYGAEEWKLISDESSADGRRTVVIFANYGKKYLAIRGGKLTGVSQVDDDCKWILD